MPDQNLPIDRPAAVTVYLHVGPHQVRAERLASGAHLILGDDHANVTVLGDLDGLIAVAGQALDLLANLRGE